jgi:hypothetical protein
LGSRREDFRAIEVGDAEKVPVLRAYIARWWFEVSRFFDVSGANAPDDELARATPQHLVFRIEADGS